MWALLRGGPPAQTISRAAGAAAVTVARAAWNVGRIFTGICFRCRARLISSAAIGPSLRRAGPPQRVQVGVGGFEQLLGSVPVLRTAGEPQADARNRDQLAGRHEAMAGD